MEVDSGSITDRISESVVLEFLLKRRVIDSRLALVHSDLC